MYPHPQAHPLIQDPLVTGGERVVYHFFFKYFPRNVFVCGIDCFHGFFFVVVCVGFEAFCGSKKKKRDSVVPSLVIVAIFVVGFLSLSQRKGVSGSFVFQFRFSDF